MTGGFWAGAIPPWAYVTIAAACLLFLCVGELDGWRRGEREAREDEAWAREQAKARRTHPVYRVPGPPELGPIELDPVAQRLGLVPPEVAHEAWLAHTEQAMHLVREVPLIVSEDPESLAYWKSLDVTERPDARSDEEWMADEFAKLHAFMAAVLDAHPATEEL